MPTHDHLATRAFLSLLAIGFLTACEAEPMGFNTQKTVSANASQMHGIHGKVLDLTGKPAGGVSVVGTLLSNNAGGLISNNAGGLISNNSSNLISNGSGLYRVQSGIFETKTKSDGSFFFNTSDDQVLTLEAIQREDMKALQLGAVPSNEAITLQLAPTGNIQGQVIPADPAITDRLNIDVFIPGTSYIAKTDADGKFVMTNVPRGRYTLVADHRDLGRAVLQGVMVVSEETARPPLLALSTHTPVLQAVTPTHGAPGSTIVLKGDHFGVSSGKHPTVYLNGVAAQVTQATDKELHALVPLGSKSGDIRVQVSGLDSVNIPFRVLQRLDVFPEYRKTDIHEAFATPPTSDVLAVGATRSYHVRAFDTEGRLIPSPSVSWTTIGDAGTSFAAGVLDPSIPGRLAISAVSGGLQSAPLSIDLLPEIEKVLVTPNPLPELNPVNPAIPPSLRSPIPDWVQLEPKLGLVGNAPRESLFWFEALHDDLSVSATGRVSVRAGAPNGWPRVKITPVADPSKFLELPIPVKRQGDLSFIIE